MKTYFKIISAIVLSSILLSILSSVVLLLLSTEDIEFAVFLPVIFFGTGVLVITPIASLLWFFSYKILSFFQISEIKKHLVSVIISSILCPLVMQLIGKNNANDIKNMFDTFIIIVPVAAISFLFFRYLYLPKNSKT